MFSKRKLGLFLIVAITFFSLLDPSVQAKGKNETAYIDVAVATLWTEPGEKRPIDAPALDHPVDMWQWTSSMTLDDKLWLVGELQTQALYGHEVTILEEQGDWVKVAVHEQPTPKHDIGYPAWMPKKQLANEASFASLKENKPFVLVTKPTVWLYEDKHQRKPFMEISFNTRLPLIADTGDELLVATPSDGKKWISADDVDIYESEDRIPAPTADDLIETGKKFLDLPYLWAGTSGFGFDCSGFTYTIFKAHGITIPRDSSVQATHGEPVEKENLQKGDLLFFAYEEGKGAVHHVGMYMGDGKMIHSPNSSKTVEIIDVFESDYYSSEYAGARRYIE